MAAGGLNIHRPRPSMSAMGKLNDIWRGLSRFLHDPTGPITKGWALIKAAIPPEALAKSEDLRNAVVLYSHVADGMVDFIKLRTKQDGDDGAEDKQEKLAT